MPGFKDQSEPTQLAADLAIRNVSLVEPDAPPTAFSPPSVSIDTDALRVGMQGEAVLIGPTRPWIWKWVRLPIRRLGWVMGW
jgi:hypothetical protein